MTGYAAVIYEIKQVNAILRLAIKMIILVMVKVERSLSQEEKCE